MNQLNLMCPINGTGYGITSKNIAARLQSQEVEVSLFPIGQASVDDQKEQELLIGMMNNAMFYSPDSPTMKIWHQHDLATRPGRGYYFAYPFFELDTFTQAEIHQLKNVDHLFTASEWGKRILAENGVHIPTTVAPLGINPEIFNMNTERIKFTQDKYIFLHVGKWELRKGQDFLIEAFNTAFTDEDYVELWLVPHNPFLNERETAEWKRLATTSPLSHKIKILDRLPTQKHLAEVMSNASCGVFLSRAEGWNNEIPEMMALDKPIIATDYSAHTEYCNEDNCLLVKIDETETANDSKWFKGQGNWAKLGEKQMEQTVEYMRFVYNKNIRSNPSGVDTAAMYVWDRTSAIIRSTIFN